MNDKTSPGAIEALTLDQLYHKELDCLEQLAAVRTAIERKHAEFEEARARFGAKTPGTPGRKPKVPT